MAVRKSALLDTSFPPYEVNREMPFWAKADIAVAEMPDADDILLLTKLPTKCYFAAHGGLTPLSIVVNDFTSFVGTLILCDEDGGNPVELLAAITLDTLTSVDFQTALATLEMFYDASGRYLALKAETTAPSAAGSIVIGGTYASGITKSMA
jgi:hypothetical protein